MFGRRPSEDNEYDPSNDGPEANLNREELAAKRKRHLTDRDIIEDLLNSLRPEHAYWKLLSWATINKWNLSRHKKKL